MNRLTHIGAVVSMFRGLGLGLLLLMGTCGGAEGVATNTPAAGTTGVMLRDPFLPLDSDGKTEAASTSPAGPAITGPSNPTPTVDPRTLIHVQGFVRKGDRVYALINGRTASKGDTITIQSGTATYRFLVRDITNRNVVVDPAP